MFSSPYFGILIFNIACILLSFKIQLNLQGSAASFPDYLNTICSNMLWFFIVVVYWLKKLAWKKTWSLEVWSIFVIDISSKRFLIWNRFHILYDGFITTSTDYHFYDLGLQQSNTKSVKIKLNLCHVCLSILHRYS